MQNAEPHTFDVGTVKIKNENLYAGASTNAAFHPRLGDMNKFHFMPGPVFTEDKRKSVFNYQRQIWTHLGHFEQTELELIPSECYN